MSRDRLYRRQLNSVAPFAFDEDVAAVFDDMVSRSIPLYSETLRLTAEMIRWHARTGDTIIDVGASTGVLMSAIAPTLQSGQLALRVVDTSPAMIRAAAARAAELGVSDAVKMECEDIRNLLFEGETVVVLNYVLQFLPVVDRLPLLKRIREQADDDALLVVSEKTLPEHPAVREMVEEFYYAFKRRNGYSDEEISQKRIALDGVLIPMTSAWNEEMLRSAGFSKVQQALSWMPFVTWIARP